MRFHLQSLILSISIFTLSTQADASTCFPLTGSLCAPFNQMNIQPLAGVFTDSKSFDVYMTSMLDTNTSYISDYQQRYGCPGYNGQGQRYHMSSYCGLFVNTGTSNGCTNTPETQVCTSVISSALASLNTLYASSACTPAASLKPDQLNARKSFIDQYTQYQSNLNLKNPTCIAGLQQEVASCGFFTAQEGQSYCTQNQSDACCQSAQFGNTTALVTIPLEQSASPQSQPANNGLVIGAGIAGFFALLLIVFLTLYIIRRRRENKQSTGKFADGPIQVAETCDVIYNYVPNLSDEVYLYVGDKVIVKCKFDDGWALGYNMSTKQEGSFPMACVSGGGGNGDGETMDNRTTYRHQSTIAGGDEKRINSRASSLYVPRN